MKSIPSIAYFTCMLAPCMVDSFTSTSLRIPQSQTIQSTPPTPSNQSPRCIDQRSSTTSLTAQNNKYSNGRSSSRYASNQERTKRQSRVGQVVRAELATVLHRNTIKNDNDPIENDLRRRINIVHADVSPDLRQARITVSIMGGADRKNDAIAKRRGYAWLVRNTKAIRFALAARMDHMKGGSPDLTFVQVDVGAAVDVMQLIEKVSEGYKREDVSMDFEGEWDEDEEDDDDGWFDFDEEGDGITVEV